MNRPENISCLSSGAVGRNCPMKSTHEKFDEAHWFAHEMVRLYHEGQPFRFVMSAFLQAARSTTFFLQKDLRRVSGFRSFYQAAQNEMKSDPTLRRLNAYRVKVVHEGSLTLASKMYIGKFRYGRAKLGFGNLELDPLTPTAAVMNAMRNSFGLVSPWRDGGEELGVHRKWVLQELASEELIAFARASLQKIGSVVCRAHTIAGVPEPEVDLSCLGDDGHMTILESQLYPEVLKAWEGPPAEVVKAAQEELVVTESVNPQSKVLHVIRKGQEARGWVSRARTWNDHGYRSIILYRIDGAVVSSETCGYIDDNAAIISKIGDRWAGFEAEGG